jgi:hypothetical protein
MSEIISKQEYDDLPESYKKWFTLVGKQLSFYCQNLCGEKDFSVAEWIYVCESIKDLSEAEQNKILHPEPCEKQCFACMSIVGETRFKTQLLK